LYWRLKFITYCSNNITFIEAFVPKVFIEMNDKKTNKKDSEKDEKHLELNEPKVQYYGIETLPESDNLNPASWNPEYNLYRRIPLKPFFLKRD